jgi:MFS family permease
MNQPASMSSKAATKTPGYAWVVLFAIYIATIAAPLNQMKVPPVLPVLTTAFNLEHNSNAGMLMSIFSIMGFVLAIPAGYILQKIGIKMTGLISIGAVMAGAALGALAKAPDGIMLLYAGRFIEGAGMGLIMVAAPAAISVWFPAAKRGMPLGIWATSIGIASIAALNFAPALEASSGWRAVWWAGAIVAAVAFVLFGILFRMPKGDEILEAPVEEQSTAANEKPLSLTKAMANRDLWLISFAFGCFNLTVMAWTTFYPGFLAKSTAGYSLANASFITSIPMMIALFSGPMGGFLSDRLGSRKKVIAVPFILLALFFLFPFNITGWMIPALMIPLGLIVGPIAPACLAAIPEIMKSPRLAGIGLGVIALCQNLGMFIGPAFFGKLVDLTSWNIASYLMIPLCLAAVIATWVARIR